MSTEQLELGALLRDDGIARAELGAMPWGAIAYEALEHLCANQRTVTSDEVWAELDRRGIPRPDEGRAMGAVMVRAMRAGMIVSDGFTQGTNPKHHRDVMRVYRVPGHGTCDRCHELIHDHDCPSVGDGRPSEAPPPYSRWVVPSGWRFTNLGHCRTCGAEVAWCRTPAGKPAPVNPDGVSHFATCPQADQHRRFR